MADIALSPSGDMLIENNALVLAEGDDAIVQQMTIRFKFALGEWFLDKRLGVPVFEEIFVKNPDFARIRAIYRQIILTTPGIGSIEEFNLNFDGAIRKLSLTFRARKSDGTLLDYSKEFIIK